MRTFSPDELAARLRDEADGLTAGQVRLMNRLVLTVEANAKRLAPVKEGHLRRSITSEVERAGARGIVGTNLSYAVHVHEGTRPHVIEGRGKMLRFRAGGETSFRKRIQHPGTKGQPFLVEGLQASERAIGAILEDAGVKVVEGIAR